MIIIILSGWSSEKIKKKIEFYVPTPEKDVADRSLKSVGLLITFEITVSTSKQKPAPNSRVQPTTNRNQQKKLSRCKRKELASQSRNKNIYWNRINIGFAWYVVIIGKPIIWG